MSKEIREQTEGEKKLSQLLGEYMEERKKNPEGFLDISTALMAGFKATDAYMVSKYFGFIERLIQNDKVELPTSCAIDKNNDYSEREIKSDYESLLMLLAIQDEPVKFLSEILKDEQYPNN